MGAGASLVSGSAAGVEVLGGPFGYIVDFGIYNSDSDIDIDPAPEPAPVPAPPVDTHHLQQLSQVHCWIRVARHLTALDRNSLACVDRSTWGVVSFDIGGSSYSRAVISEVVKRFRV